MTMSNQCKWISFGVMSLTVILLLLLFYSLETRSRCPEDNQLRYKEDGKCYERHWRGPCGEGFVLAEYEPKSHMGACSCPFMFTNRTLLYYKGECRYIFSQGGCPDGHWLNVTLKGEPICEINRCLQEERNGLGTDKNANDDMKSKDQFDQNMHNMNGHRVEYERTAVEIVPLKDGRCAKLNEFTEGCPPGSVVRFHPNVIRPSCHEPRPKNGTMKMGISIGAIAVGSYTSCPSGSARAISMSCYPIFDFDSDTEENASDTQEG